MTAAPVLVEVERGGVAESVHRGHVVVVDEAGQVVWTAGDPDAVIFPRSAVKPLQAAGMLRAGLSLSGSWLALACASHSGEAFHLRTVEQMLASGGLTVADLGCPADWPLDQVAEREYVAAGGVAAPVAMNCSGKHAGMLLTCVARGWSTHDYLRGEHPLQRVLRDTVCEVAGPIQMTSVDGCGAPLWGLRLSDLARAFRDLPVTAPEVVAAMRAYPEYVAGTRRDITQLISQVPGLVAKDGAEGVQAVSVDVLGRRYGVAVKIADGADRARPVVTAAVLRELGVDAAVLEQALHTPVLGAGKPVGRLRPTFGAGV